MLVCLTSHATDNSSCMCEAEVQTGKSSALKQNAEFSKPSTCREEIMGTSHKPTFREVCGAVYNILKETDIVVNAIKAGIRGQNKLPEQDKIALAKFETDMKGFLGIVDPTLSECIKEYHFDFDRYPIPPPWGGSSC